MRISLLKSERQTSAGVELIQLCTTITADGSISDEEIVRLQHWLEENDSVPIPAISFLRGLVERIISDRRITDREQDELYKALERVLPKELRDVAVANRRRKEAEAIIERRKNGPAETFDFMVAGVRYENRGRLIREFAREGARVWLSREPDNPASRNAIKILVADGRMIGYMPETDAVSAAPLLDIGYEQKAVVKKLLNGKSHLIPVVVAEIFPPHVPVEEFPIAENVPDGLRWTGPVKGCLIVFAIVVIVFIILAKC